MMNSINSIIINFLNDIPDETVCMALGFLSCLCIIMYIKLGKCFIEMWKEHLEDLEAEKMETE